MAESTLSSQYSDLRIAIAHFLGFGIDADKWTENQVAIIAMILKRGLRQFYNPPRIYENEAPYEWRFLKPTTSLDTIASYSTGTIAIANGATTVTLTTGTWPSWVATHGVLVVDSIEYAISTRTDDNNIELSAAWGEDTETAAEYTLKHNGNYDLPDDFGGIEGKMTYNSIENKPDIKIVGEGDIRSMRRGTTTRSYPCNAAIRPKAHETTTVGQRFEIMFFPIPNDAYTLTYRKLILPSALVETTLIYPYGGAMHAETIEASCLAIAELQEDETKGPKWEYFVSRLTASIAIDKSAYQAQYLGYNGDNSDNLDVYDVRQRHPGTFFVTYNGER